MANVTWQQAEDALIAAVEYLALLPDRERGYLAAGKRSCWPAIIKDVQSDYADGEVAPSASLSRRMLDHLNRMLLDPQAAAMAVPEGQRALVGRVLVLKRWTPASGFGWDIVWRGEDRRSRELGQGKLTCTSDALRKRYERAVARVALVMDRAQVAA